ncbi:hypothetical protein [Leptothoe spongobia]|uniref:Uncharacterized protein n=1 Tax=Leptothoe spongobia TAU-MAC 1115 TaxID=1967444 RepID=A0A947DJA8_9CYAN|nr:hypothetical protein [Leptothoe spongobia]MBT9317688.1 hypothetical protein [Leptothoe spongobia TAU-MAC 1115]
MLDIQIENCQENLCIDLEHDSGYDADWLSVPVHLEVDEKLGNTVLVFNGSADMEDVEGLDVCYIDVDENYPWNLSPGQQKAYELLLPLQQGSTYALTTIKKLARAMELEVIRAAYKRLENLQSLGAISGLNV